MNNFRLTLNTPSKLAMVVLIDGKTIRGKKKRDKTIYNFNTTKNMIDVNIFNVVELDSPVWWLWSIFYFIIGIFGIFDRGFGKMTDRIECAFRVSMADNVNMSVGTWYKDNSVCTVQCDTMYKEIKNKVWQDDSLKKKIKLNKLLRVGLWLVSILVIVAIVLKEVL